MKFGAVIFDLDGTLLNTLEDLTDSVNYALSEMGFPERSIDEVRGFVGNGIALLVKRSVPEGTGEEETKKCLEIFLKHYGDNCAVKTAPYEGVYELLSALKQNGIKTAVVTNKAHEVAVSVVNRYFGDKIDVVIGQKPDMPTKPDPAGVFLAAEKLGAELDECVYAGDSHVDAATAKNSGLPLIGCLWGFCGIEAFENENAFALADTPLAIFEAIK